MTTVDSLKAAIDRLTHVLNTLNTARTGGFQVPLGQPPQGGGDGFQFGNPQNNSQRIDEIQETYRRESANERHNMRTGAEMMAGEMGSLLSWGGLSMRRIAGHALRVYQKIEGAKQAREEEIRRRDVWERRQMEKQRKGIESSKQRQDEKVEREMERRDEWDKKFQREAEREKDRQDKNGGSTPDSGEKIRRRAFEKEQAWKYEDEMARRDKFDKANDKTSDMIEGKEAELASMAETKALQGQQVKGAGSGGAAIAVVAVIAGLVMLGKAALDAAKSVGEMAKDLAKVSPTMAYVAQTKEIRDTMRNQRKGEMLAGSASRLLDEEAKFLDSKLSIEVMYEDLKNGFFTSILKKMNMVIELLGLEDTDTKAKDPQTAIKIAEDFARN